MRKQLLKHCCAVFLAGFIALLLLPQAAQAQSKEAYVVKSSDKKTLTFYYDDQKSSRTGSNVWGIEETKKEVHTQLGLERGIREGPKLLPLFLMLPSRTIAPKAQRTGFLTLKT